MASVNQYGLGKQIRWDSREYPFTTEFVGKNVLKGRGIAGHGSWEGQAEETGYKTLDGTLQSMYWKVPGQHRPVSIKVHHLDSSFAGSAANLLWWYWYRDDSLSINQAFGGWELLDAWVQSQASETRYFGERYERPTGEYRLQMTGTNGHIVYIAPVNQMLSFNEFEGLRQR